MSDKLDPGTEAKILAIAISKAVPYEEQDAFRRGKAVRLYPDQMLSAMRAVYLLGRAKAS